MIGQSFNDEGRIVISKSIRFHQCASIESWCYVLILCDNIHF